jgi:diacylglycerol O-acyltransferase / wax synthase
MSSTAVARLGGFDVGLLRMEFGEQSMNICTLIDVDSDGPVGNYSFEDFKDRLAERLENLPELRVKLADSRWNPDNPVWVEDPDFDIANHLHRVPGPRDGDRKRVSEVVGRIAGVPLDRARPLWEMWVIEAVDDETGVAESILKVVLKQHHAIMDGATETDMMSRLCSTEPNPAAPARIGGPVSVSSKTIALGGVARFVSRPFHMVTKLLPSLFRAIRGSVATARTGRRMASPFAVPVTSFNGNAMTARTIAFVQLDFGEVRALKKAAGVTVNDVVLALLSGALRGYLDIRGELPEAGLVTLMPIAVEERAETAGANQLSATFCGLQTQIADPLQRLKAISAASSAAKEHSAAIGSTLLRDVLQYCSPHIFGLIMKGYVKSGLSRRRPIANMSVSNVPAPNVQWYLCGERVKAMYGLPPVMYGIGLHVGVSSLNGKLEIGFVSCPELIADPWDLADRVPLVLKELQEAVA